MPFSNIEGARVHCQARIRAEQATALTLRAARLLSSASHLSLSVSHWHQIKHRRSHRRRPGHRRSPARPPPQEVPQPRRRAADLRPAAVLLDGGAEVADEHVQAAPRLLERAWARRRRGRVAEEGAPRRVHLRTGPGRGGIRALHAAAPSQLQRRPVVAQVSPNVYDSYRLGRAAATPGLSAAAATPAISMARSPPVHAGQPRPAPAPAPCHAMPVSLTL